MTMTMYLATGISQPDLTRSGTGRSLMRMTNRETTAFGLTVEQLAELAKRATSEASKANLRAGIPVTGMVDGRIHTRYPDGTLIAGTPQGKSNVFAE
jgi:hypothetical protein